MRHARERDIKGVASAASDCGALSARQPVSFVTRSGAVAAVQCELMENDGSEREPEV
jgi:hypothetical protein